MNARALAAGLVLLVALAGCGGLVGDDPATETPGDSQPAPVYEPPLDGRAVLDAHRAALAANRTVRYVRNDTLRYADGGRALVANETARLDLGDGRLLVHRNVSLRGESDVYVGPDGAAYERRRSGERVVYGDVANGATNASTYAAPPLARYVDAMDYTYIGSAEANGTWVHTYVVGGVDGVAASADFGPLDGANLTEANSTLRITDEGRLRSLTIALNGTGRGGVALSRTLRIRYTAVGSTTVEEPAWVRTARSRSD